MVFEFLKLSQNFILRAGIEDLSYAKSAKRSIMRDESDLKPIETARRCVNCQTVWYLKSTTPTGEFPIIRYTSNCPWIINIPMEVNNLIPETQNYHFLRKNNLIPMDWCLCCNYPHSISFIYKTQHHTRVITCAQHVWKTTLLEY